MERELELARQIQEALLPARLPCPPGWRLIARNTPSRGVSGDFYTVVERGSELALTVADVSGKGVGAALLTASLEALIASALDRGEAPDEVCASVSRLLAARTPRSKFATAFLAVLDPATGELVAANAGHNPALVVRADGTIDEIGATGVPLGLVPELRYEARRAQLDPGDLLAVYTDGITEARNESLDEYGVERLVEVLRSSRTCDLVEVVDRVRSDLEAFVDGEPFGDDRTLLLVRRDP
jgi:sigma-B regulation protein RsbU (phosphoserine phosphatase)